MKFIFSSKSKVFLYSFIFVLSNLQALSVDNLLKEAYQLQLEHSYIWKNLLHINDGEPSINNQDFLLSYPNFNLKKEFTMTLKSFFSRKNLDDAHAICKYPARYLWIKDALELSDKDFPKVTCSSLSKYLSLTSFEKMSLIFVSENVNSPSSMMGHIFFKISGKNSHNHITNDAVSFFTVIETINIASLMVKSLVTGMQGYFILKPYHLKMERYLKKENRNMWECELNLDEFSKKLIYLHFWELKDIDIKYLFTGFNCATIVSNMLAIRNKNYAQEQRLWITPKDVIKDAQKYGLIKLVIFYPSEDWYLNMLYEELGSNGEEIINQLNTKNIKDIKFSKDLKEALLEKELLIHYAKKEHKNNHLSKKTFEKIQTLYDKQINYPKLDFSEYKNPIKTPDDTQLTMGYYKKKKDYIQLQFLPASNYLHDDNREYFSENELKIGQLDLLINQNKVKVNQFDLYSMKSIVPWNPWTKNISKELKINYEQHYNNHKNYGAYNISGGLGYSKKIGEDIYLYSLFNIGLGYGDSRLYPYLFLDNGLLLYEIWNMKTTLNHQYIYNQDNSYKTYNKFELHQSIFLNENFNLNLKINYLDDNKNSEKNYGFGVSYFF